MIFGALVSLITAGAYAVADEIRARHKIASYRPVTETKRRAYDVSKAIGLSRLFYANWCYGGASLYPQKLIPFLASDEKIRRLWVDRAIELILGGEDPYKRNDTEEYIKFDPQSKMRVSGPQLYEYDFVATYYPEDWEKYKQYKAEQKRQAEESRLAVKKKRFTQEKQLWRYPVPNDNWKIILTCAIVSALIITIVLLFILK